jgi:replicative DNA helicase
MQNGLPDSLRLPPHNLDAERDVLGAVFLDNAVFPEVQRLLTDQEFYRDAHQIVFRAMCAVYAQGAPITLIGVADELTHRGELVRVGGIEFLGELMAAAPHAANAAYHAAIVREKAITRRAIEMASDVLRQGYSQLLSADQILAQAAATLFGLMDSGAACGLTAVRDLMPALRERIARRQSGEVDGIGTGLADFDYATGGLQPGQLVVLAARPSMGKTALALNISDYVAVQLKLPVLFVSLEMSEDQVVERLVVSRGRLMSSRVANGYLDDRSLAAFHEAADALEASDLYLNGAAVQGLIHIIAAARSMAVRHKVGLVVVDYIQLVDGAEKGESRQEQVAKVSRGLKSLARELKVPVLALSQLNRNVENREDKRPRMADLRESGQIEADADLILLLYRPEYYDPNDQPGVAELIVAKNRSGPTGNVKLTFLKEAMRFESLAPEPIDSADF